MAIPQAAFALDHRRHQQVFGTGVEGGLEDVGFAPHAPRRGVGQGGLADAGLAQEPRVHRQVLFVDHHPGRQQLPHQLVLPHPLDGEFVRMGEVQGNAIDLDRHILSLHYRTRYRRPGTGTALAGSSTRVSTR
jgi:ribosomal protein S18 acetylase RimI-like enzyme